MIHWGLIAGIVFAAESVLSPIPDGYVPDPVPTVGPLPEYVAVSAGSPFGDLIHSPVMSQVPAVLGDAAETPAASSTPRPLPTAARTSQAPHILPTATPTPTVQAHVSKKQAVTIALLGDSMIDTLGPSAPHMVGELKRLYPATSFSVINYGVGGENLDSAISRIASSHTYLGVSYPPLAEKRPDIVVIESCGYNPYSEGNVSIDRHWLALSRAVDSVKANIPGARIVIAATIAPNTATFGDGAPGISFSAEDKRGRTKLIGSYLENTVRFAKSQRLPLADAYHPSQDASGDGKIEYVNGGDHIHYSDAGRQLFGSVVAKTILESRLIE